MQSKTARYDLIVIGAGIGGLNALYAAARYLPKTARVLLLDQKEKAGGMWNTAYDYVRLHQPHPMFTTGNLAWNWNKPRHYLATRDETQFHLESTLSHLTKSIQLETRFEVTVTACEEVTVDDRAMARVTLHSNDTSKKVTNLYAKRVIHAAGLNIGEMSPLEFDSDQVISIAPNTLIETLARNPRAPVVVVGGGKTGMDTIMAILADDPNRHVTLIKGRGTHFMNRTKYWPRGVRRWFSGQLYTRMFRNMALRFDGHNGVELMRYFGQTYGVDPKADNDSYLFGSLSRDEWKRISNGIAKEVSGYLDTVVDGDTGPQLQLRDGRVIQTKPDTIIVNCTGSVFRSPEPVPAMPLLSPKRTIVSINPRSAFHFLSYVSSFFVIHLFYRKRLQDKGFYAVDHEALFRADRKAWFGAACAQSYLNIVLASQNLPIDILDACGFNHDQWYPRPRQILGYIQMKSTAQKDIQHCTKVLEATAKRFPGSCWPIL